MYRPKMVRTCSASARLTMIRPPLGSMSYPSTGWPPIHLPFRRAADILSRVWFGRNRLSRSTFDTTMQSTDRVFADILRLAHPSPAHCCQPNVTELGGDSERF